MRRHIQIGVVILFVLGMVACSPVTPAMTTSDRTSAEGHYSLTTKTGVTEIDSVLAAVASGDDEKLRSLIQFTDARCTRAEGLGGPPKCREGEEEGMPVQVLPILGPEGHFFYKNEIEAWNGIDVSGLYAIYEVSSNAFSDENYPAGEYAIVFIGNVNEPAITLQLRDGRIVRVDYLFDDSLEILKQILERDAAEFVLPPLNQ